MKLIKEQDEDTLTELMKEQLKGEVDIYVFTESTQTKMTAETEKFADDLAEISDKIHLTVYSASGDPIEARQFGIKQGPAFVVCPRGSTVVRLRIYGNPYGYMMNAILSVIRDVSLNEADLSIQSVEQLVGIKKPTHVEIYTLPTCRYSPSAVILAHRLAMLNHNITVDAIDAMTFPHLADQNGVGNTPHVIVNHHDEFIGLPEEKEFTRLVVEGSQA